MYSGYGGKETKNQCFKSPFINNNMISTKVNFSDKKELKQFYTVNKIKSHQTKKSFYLFRFFFDYANK